MIRQCITSAGFVQRQFQLISPDSPNLRTLYRIDKRGVELLKIEYGYQAQDLRYSPQEFLKEMFLHHTIGLSEIRLQLQKSCQRNNLELLTWEDEKVLKKGYDKVMVRSKQVPVLPDGYVEITKGESKYRFFIEYDRDSEDDKFLKKKLLALKNYFEHGGCKARYGTNKIRVLFITEGKNAQKRITKILSSDWGRSLVKWFWFHALSSGEDNLDFLTDLLWQTSLEGEYKALIG